MREEAALKNLLGLAYCSLPPPAISAWVQKPGQVPGEHLAFCCEEGRIRKSNAPVDWEPIEGGGEAGGAWQRLGHIWGACLSLDCCREEGGGQGLGGGPAALTILSSGTPQFSTSGAEPAEGRWVEKVPA